LQEYGLIATDINSFMDYQAAILREGNTVSCFMTYQNAPWALIPKFEVCGGSGFLDSGIS
jgi:hypothetical protein